ncbi:DUF4064 domain-containing protein [Bacillus sp. 2205SS5-2]|uniref:DUF4064 domain-containing protein n=1 Tax=Bacillus sp. 2205SS5-2 TaxID=3109031 RepID=UPI003005DF54
MKRTVEIVLSVIGVITSVLMAFAGGFFALLLQNEQVLADIEAEFTTDPDLADVNPTQFIEMIGGAGWVIVAAGVIGLVIGLIAIFSLKGNKKPKLAGILLIIGAVIIALMTLLFGWLPALLFLIAGIMSLVRKPKQDVY